MDVTTIIQIVFICVIVYVILKMSLSENLCMAKQYGMVTNVPVSSLANANMGLINDSSLGQAPLGDPQYWRGPVSPLTQGQYGLYLQAPDLSETQPFNPQKVWGPIAKEMPVYTTTASRGRGQCQ